MSKEQAVFDILESLAIPFQTERTTSNPMNQCQTVFIKSISDNQTYLVLTPFHKEINFDSLQTRFSHTELQPLSEDVIYRYLKLRPDAVSPFGLIYDLNKEIRVIIDNEIKSKDEIRLQANVRHTQVVFNAKNLMTFLSWLPNQVEYMDL